MPKEKILIVEDEGIEALDVQYRLRSLGYTAGHIAFSGEEAVKKVEETCPDLVLMDIMLQGEIDGVTAADQIRARFDIPVIYLTAYADEATLQRAKITEPYGYIVKPFKEREVHIAIDMALYRHRMERRLKESEKWLATTLRSIGDGVIATDNSGRITFMNGVAEDLTGWKLEEVLNKKLTEIFNIVNMETGAAVENPVTRVILEGTVVGLANHTLLIARDGREIPIDDNASPIKDDKGNVIGVILVFRDVIERQKAEDALRESEQRFRMLADGAPVLIWMNGVEGCEFANRAYLEFVGVSGQVDLQCYDFAQFVHPEDSEAYARAYFDCCARREPFEAQFRFRRHDGVYRWMKSTGLPRFTPAGEFLGYIGSTLDVTDIVEYISRLEELDSLKDEFLSIAAHELKTPLAGLLGFAQTILRQHEKQGSIDPERLSRALHVIVQQASKLSMLVSQLLDISRIEGGRLTLERQQVDLARLVKDVAAAVTLSTTQHELVVEAPPQAEAFVDPLRIEQVVTNLIDNAIRYSPEGGLVEIGVAPEDDGVEVTVRDHGIGIPPEHLPHIFQRLYRAQQDGHVAGLGLGLYISSQIVALHGGRIQVECPADGGTSFSVRLPTGEGIRDKVSP